MGLDMYAYAASKAGQQNEFFSQEGLKYDSEIGEYVAPEGSTVERPVEFSYWRKHPNLHGWMEQLWLRKLGESNQPTQDRVFNGVELELTEEDLDDLERAITTRKLPQTTGFFFGNNADDHYYDQDLSFISEARYHLTVTGKVFYTSSW